MSATEPLYHLIVINPCKLTKEEIQLLEAELFVRICEELREFFSEQNKGYFRLMKFNIEQENDMLESKFVRFIIRDILSTEEYSLNGIAYYTNTHEDVVGEVLAGRNTNPSATFLRRVIELHRSVRRDLYNSIIKKITKQYLAMT
jgi:SMI1-KNR4 cell-wall